MEFPPSPPSQCGHLCCDEGRSRTSESPADLQLLPTDTGHWNPLACCCAFEKAACVHSQVDVGPSPPLAPPQRPLVGPQQQDGRGDQEQQHQQPLTGGTAQQGDAAVAGGWQARKGDPVVVGEEGGVKKQVTTTRSVAVRSKTLRQRRKPFTFQPKYLLKWCLLLKNWSFF